MGARKYRELYRRESAAQAAISGYSIGMRARGASAWDVEATFGDWSTHARVDVLVWSDLVRDAMSGSVFSAYADLCRLIRIYLGSGALIRLLRLRKGPMIAAIYPVIVMLGQLALACGVVGVFWTAMASLHPWLGPLSLAALPLLLRWWRTRDRMFAWYLMQVYAFCAGAAGATPTVLTPRLKAFSDRVANALADQTLDEVLVVGHSAGAHLSIIVLAHVLRSKQVPDRGPKLGLLTLGQVIPMVSFLPRANSLRSDLVCVAKSDRLTWVDVSAPGDGASFALCDPVAVTGLAPQPKHGPLVISAAFTKSLSPERWGKLKRRFFRLHFQYLHAFDYPEAYDYFAITAGPCTLAERYAGRVPSASRIERPLSGHTDVAA